MPQDKAFVNDIIDVLAPLDVRTRAMFGAFGMYCDDTFVAIIDDDQLFIKPSGADPNLFAETERCPPYPGAKDYHLVTTDLFGESEWLREAIQATADALPTPKPKNRKIQQRKNE